MKYTLNKFCFTMFMIFVGSHFIRLFYHGDPFFIGLYSHFSNASSLFDVIDDGSYMLEYVNYLSLTAEALKSKVLQKLNNSFVDMQTN